MIHPAQCPHFSLCSGCELGQDFLTPPIWVKALSFFKKQGIDAELISEGFSQTRMRAKLAVRSNLQTSPEIGLFKKGTHEVVSIPHCLVHHPAINRAVSILSEEIGRNNIEPYSENPPRGSLRYVQLSVEEKTAQIQLVLVSTQKLDTLCESLLQYDLWHSVWLNRHPTLTNRILGDSWELIHGKPFLWQKICGVQIPFHPGAFSQSHRSLFEKMVFQIANWVDREADVLELYAGVGAIGLVLAQKAKSVTFVENNPWAYLSFQQCETSFPYLCMDAKEASLEGHDVIIVDPPRKGLDQTLLQKFLKLPKGRLIYVSCGFDSFQRDGEELIAAGWKMKEAKGYLLFPGTNHVEIVALFVKEK